MMQNPATALVVYVLVSVLAASTPVWAVPPLAINEVMAANSTFAKDLSGDFDDWIEIYNGGRTSVDMAGMYLTDDPAVPTKWQFPLDGSAQTTVTPRGYLIVWADAEPSGIMLHVNFRLDADGDGVYLFDADGATLIDSLVFAEQTPDVSYGRYPDAGETLRFFGAPTPGQPNNEGYLGEVEPLRFSHERGFYDEPFALTITCPTAGAEIIYTLNGKRPDDESGRFRAGQTYAGPLSIGTTVVLRAMAVKPNWKPTAVYTHTYLLNVSESRRSLPAISLVGDTGKTFYEPDGVMAIVGGSYEGGVWTSTGTGSYNNVLQRGLERPVSCEWIEPQDNSGFQIDCGLRVHGSDWMRPRYRRADGVWSGDAKFSFRLYFRKQYGPGALKFPLFPESDVDSFQSVVLRAGHNDRTNPFVKDELLRRLHKDMGQRASMGTFANLFINGQYKGYFNPTEHIKDDACQAWFDSNEPWDVMTMSGIRDGNSQSWNEMLNYARSSNLAVDAYYQELSGKLDVTSFIDYLIIRLWPNDWDWPQNNWAAAAERSSTGRWKFFVWDAEGTFVSSQINDERFGELNSQGNANGQLYRALKASDRFRQLFGDRLYKHFNNGGALTMGNVSRRFAKMEGQLDGVIPNMNTYVVDGWTPNRRDVFLDACAREGMYTFDGPIFAVDRSFRYGGYASQGDLLQMISTQAGGEVFYTLDGSDPSALETAVEQPVINLVGRDTPKRVLVPSGPPTEDWRGFRGVDETGWLISEGLPGGVGYERNAGYEDYITTNVERLMYGVNGSCYVRIPFTFSGDRDTIEQLTLSMRYDDGFVAYLNGTEVARRNFEGEPAWNSLATASQSDTNAVVAESIDVSDALSKLRAGANVLAIQGLNVSTTSSDFLIVAELNARRAAAVTTPPGAEQYAEPIPLTESVRIKARARVGNTWSALSDAVFGVGPVAESLRVSEIMYHPADPNAEYIELTNIGPMAVNLNLVRFADGVDFTFSDFALAPQDYVLIVKNADVFEATYGPGLPIAGTYTGSLSNAGESIELQDATGAVIQRVDFRDDWYPITDGDGFSLTARDPMISAGREAWRPSAIVGGSPGFDDATLVPELGTVVINEVLANAVDGTSDWIELHNTTDRTVDIGGWFLSDDRNVPAKYEISAGTTIDSRGYLLFTADQHFGNESDAGCLEPFGLSQYGESVYLRSGGDGEMTGYSERAAFGPSEPGVTYGRCETSSETVDFVAMAGATPGQANADPAVGPLVISEIMYHPETSEDAEYVELINISDAPVTLYDFVRQMPWRFTDDPEDPGIDLLFPEEPPVTLGPYERLVLVKDRTILATLLAIPPAATVLEWGGGHLNNAGETLQLSRPADLDKDGQRQWIVVDQVTYGPGLQSDDPWPSEADGFGLSLTRLVAETYGNDPANWSAADPSPGSARPRPIR